MTDWTAIVNDAEDRVLCEAFDKLNDRMRLLQREAEKWKREAKTTKDRATKIRLAGQAQWFQQQYAQITLEHDALQQRNAALQERLRGGH